MVGGQIALTYTVDNYPGFSEGITGPELVNKFRAHAERFGAVFLDKEATAVDFSSSPFKVYVGENEYESNSIIIATGSLNRRLGLESEDRLLGRGVFVCATCDAILYEGKIVVVVGGGDSAVQEALDMAKFAKEVYLIHRRDVLTACNCLSQMAHEEDRIRFVWNTVVEDILGEKRVTGVRLRNTKTEEVWTMMCDGVLIAIGWDPNTSLLKGQIKLDEEGYVVSQTGVDTSVEGVFIAGDLNDKRYRQVITACGSGCKAALEVEKYLGSIN
jgi:thioredoxin reductase (NADPH)